MWIAFFGINAEILMLHHDGFRDVDVGSDYDWIHAAAFKDKEIRCLTWKYSIQVRVSLKLK